MGEAGQHHLFQGLRLRGDGRADAGSAWPNRLVHQLLTASR